MTKNIQEQPTCMGTLFIYLFTSYFKVYAEFHTPKKTKSPNLVTGSVLTES